MNITLSRRGDNRQVSVYKTKKEGKENLVSFRFSAEAKDVLQDMFSRYPPDDREMAENEVGECSIRTYKVQQRKGDIFCKPEMTKSEIAREVVSLASRIEKSPYLRQV